MNIIILFLTFTILFIILQYYCNNIEVYEFDSKVKGIHLLLIGGTHGNEPSGSVALFKFIKEMQDKKYNLKIGKITIIPKPNKLGLLFNKRNLLHRLYNKDLNRNYPRNAKEKALDPISAKIMDYVNKSDWILDFHEGWGYIYENKGSMGSGIFPGNTENSITMANNILTSINSAINSENKFGLEKEKHPDIRSLKSYANYLQKNYILIETSGQNDIQPIEIRVEQILYIIDFFLRFNDMI